MTIAACLLQFVGITCGLSAPYVAGQVAYAMEQVHGVDVMLQWTPHLYHMHTSNSVLCTCNSSDTCKDAVIEIIMCMYIHIYVCATVLIHACVHTHMYVYTYVCTVHAAIRAHVHADKKRD